MAMLGLWSGSSPGFGSESGKTRCTCNHSSSEASTSKHVLLPSSAPTHHPFQSARPLLATLEQSSALSRSRHVELTASVASSAPPSNDASPRRSITVWSVVEQSSGVLGTILTNPIGAAVMGVTVTGTSALLWWRYFRRIPTAEYVTPAVLKYRKVLVGRVVSVGDADGFRFYHTPGPPFLREWLYPWPPRTKGKGKRSIVQNTISVRLAGVDAPESGHFGKPAQPFSKEAKTFLTSMVHPDNASSSPSSRSSSFFSSSSSSNTTNTASSGPIPSSRLVWICPSHIDQYKRLVATPYIWSSPYIFGKTNVSLQMVKQGLATVYRASGADYGQATLWNKFWRKSTTGLNALERAETKAKRQKVGMWSLGKKFESPEEYKRRHKMGGD